MKQTVVLIDDTGSSSRYEIKARRKNGTLVLKPDTSLRAIRERAGGAPVSVDEFEKRNGVQLLPPDDTP